jgi:hypothetical protein
VITAPHPVGGGVNYLNGKHAGLNGQLYAVNRNSAKLGKFNSSTRAWEDIAGTGITGVCVDGTAALSCNIDPLDVFVSASGQVYFVDRGRIRTIDSSGNVVTLAGQSFFFGDGGSALSARFNIINNIDQTASGDIIVLDNQEARFRQFAIGGTISTIAGDGTVGTPNTTSLATTQPLDLIALRDSFKIDPSNGDVFFNRGPNHIGKLDRSTGKWVNIVGGGTNNYYDAGAEGSSSIILPGNSWTVARVLGFNGTHLLVHRDRILTGSSSGDVMLKLFNLSTLVQNHLAGVSGANGTSFCSDGSALATCQIPSPASVHALIGATYDATGSRWLTLRTGTTQIRTLTPGGNIGTLTTLPNTPTAFAYRRTGSTPAEIIYYCSTSDSKLHKYDLSTDTALAWPVTSMSCAGTSLIYNSVTNSLIFIYVQNGMYGVAEYLNP